MNQSWQDEILSLPVCRAFDWKVLTGQVHSRQGKQSEAVLRCWPRADWQPPQAYTSRCASHTRLTMPGIVRRAATVTRGGRTRIPVTVTVFPQRARGCFARYRDEWGPPPTAARRFLVCETGNRATRTALVHRTRICHFHIAFHLVPTYHQERALPSFLPRWSLIVHMFAIESVLMLNYGETKRTRNCYITRWKRKKKRKDTIKLVNITEEMNGILFIVILYKVYLEE